jgi:hypothetical protein
MSARGRFASALAGTRVVARRLELLARAGGRAVSNPAVFFGELDGYLRRRGAISSATVAPAADLPNVVPLYVELDAALAPRLNVLIPGLSLNAMTGGPEHCNQSDVPTGGCRRSGALHLDGCGQALE